MLTGKSVLDHDSNNNSSNDNSSNNNSSNNNQERAQLHNQEGRRQMNKRIL